MRVRILNVAEKDLEADKPQGYAIDRLRLLKFIIHR